MKRTNSGDLNTQIIIQLPVEETTTDGRKITTTWQNVYTAPVWCRWKNIHGRELLEAMNLKLTDPVTLQMRFSPLVSPRCRLRKTTAPDRADSYYRIISIDDIDNGHRMLEIKAERMVTP